jgi:hypothetical protein
MKTATFNKQDQHQKSNFNETTSNSWAGNCKGRFGRNGKYQRVCAQALSFTVASSLSLAADICSRQR